MLHDKESSPRKTGEDREERQIRWENGSKLTIFPFKDEDWLSVPVIDPWDIFLASPMEIKTVLETATRTTRALISSLGTISAKPDKQAFAVTVPDDSMNEAKIPEESKAVINPAEEIENGNAALIFNLPHNSWALRWIFHQPDGGLEIRPSSSEFPILSLSREEVEQHQVLIVGAIVEVISLPKRCPDVV